MTALPENRQPSIDSVRTDLEQLKGQKPSLEVFRAAINLNQQLVEVYMGTNPEAQQEVLDLDQEVAQFHSRVGLILQNAERRQIAEVTARHSHPRANHGRVFGLRQQRDARPSDRMAA